MPADRKRAYNHELAEEFCDNKDYLKNLVYCQQYDTFYMYREVYYEQIEFRKMQQITFAFIKANYPSMNVTVALVNDVIQQIKWTCKRQVEDIDYEYIALNDGLYNMRTFELEKHDRHKIVSYYVPYNYQDLHMEIPNFKKFINTSLVHQNKPKETDLELVRLVQEMFGFYLMDTFKVTGAFFLVGTGANGKSTMTQVVQDMIGHKYCSAMSIQTLTTDKFSTHHLIGKRLNCSNEEESKYIQSDKFKALVTGEMIDAERKFGERFEFIPRTKYLFSTNEMPSFSGMSYALKRRIKIVPFYRQFNVEQGEHDPDLGEKLKNEMPGIMLWAFEGAKRIVKNGYRFSPCRASQLAFQDFQEDSSSAVMFVNQFYMLSSDEFIPHGELYKEYRDWCNEVNRQPLAQHNFLKEIRNNFDNIKTQRVRDENQKIVYGKGLKRKPEEYETENELLATAIENFTDDKVIRKRPDPSDLF